MTAVMDAFIVWRITHFLVLEDGPWKCMFRLKVWLIKVTKYRGKDGPYSFWVELLKCYWCLSVWVAFIVAGFRTGIHYPLLSYALALSGMSVFLQLITGDK